MLAACWLANTPYRQARACDESLNTVDAALAVAGEVAGQLRFGMNVVREPGSASQAKGCEFDLAVRLSPARAASAANGRVGTSADVARPFFPGQVAARHAASLRFPVGQPRGPDPALIAPADNDDVSAAWRVLGAQPRPWSAGEIGTQLLQRARRPELRDPIRTARGDERVTARVEGDPGDGRSRDLRRSPDLPARAHVPQLDDAGVRTRRQRAIPGERERAPPRRGCESSAPAFLSSPARLRRGRTRRWRRAGRRARMQRRPLSRRGVCQQPSAPMRCPRERACPRARRRRRRASRSLRSCCRPATTRPAVSLPRARRVGGRGAGAPRRSRSRPRRGGRHSVPLR